MKVEHNFIKYISITPSTPGYKVRKTPLAEAIIKPLGNPSDVEKYVIHKYPTKLGVAHREIVILNYRDSYMCGDKQNITLMNKYDPIKVFFGSVRIVAMEHNRIVTITDEEIKQVMSTFRLNENDTEVTKRETWFNKSVVTKSLKPVKPIR